MGFKVNEMGTETRIDLTDYKRKTLRKALKRVTNSGYVIKEASSASIGIDKIEAVSDGWRQTRTYTDREVGFINRPFVLGDEVDVRKFYAFVEGKLVAFSFYDPIWDGRWSPYSIVQAAPSGLQSVHQLRGPPGGYRCLSRGRRKSLFLGLSPLAISRTRISGIASYSAGTFGLPLGTRCSTVTSIRFRGTRPISANSKEAGKPISPNKGFPLVCGLKIFTGV
jgi:hypothetical protein